MKKVLIVSAHGADWCTRCGGTIAKLTRDGYEVFVLALTCGEHGESGGFWKANPAGPLEACTECRKQEAALAAEELGVSKLQFLGYGDYPLVMDEKRIRDLTNIILDFRPDAILTHWINDPVNMDHEVAGKAVLRAVSAAGMLGARPNTPSHFIPDVFFFETTIPHAEFNEFKMDVFIDITDTYEKKIAAIKRFQCQPQLVGYYQRCAENRGQTATDWARGRRTIAYAEGFKRYTPYLGDVLPLTEL